MKRLYWLSAVLLLLCAQTAMAFLTDHQTHAVPNAARPALRMPFTDPVFGETITRITDPSMLTGATLGWTVEYNGFPAMNANNTLVFLQSMDQGGTWYVVRRSDGALITPNGILIASDPGWTWHKTDANIAIYCNGNTVNRFHADTRTSDLIATFPEYDVILCSYGGPDDTQTFHAFVGVTGCPLACTRRDVVVLNLVSGVVTKLVNFPNLYSARISPSGNYVAIVSFAADATGPGTELYTRGLVRVRHIEAYVSHQDFAFDAAGNEVYVYDAVTFSQCNEFVPYWCGFASHRLSDGTVTKLFDRTALPYWGDMHPSGIVSRGHPGWVLISTMADLSQPNQQTFGQEIFFLALDGSALGATGGVKRLAHHRSEVVTCPSINDKDYWAEAHASSSWDGSIVTYTSNWGTTLPPCSRYDVYVLSPTVAWWP